MGTFTQLDSQSPADGSNAIPVASGRYGMHDPLRQQEAVVLGKAYSFEDSTDPAKRFNIYLYGHASARSELGGVIAQDGNAPTMSIAIATGDSDCTQGCFAGLVPIMLAPGEVVKRGQHLEPIPAGANRAMWRVAVSGPAASRQYFDNSGGTEGELISADLFPCCEEPADGITAVGPSAAVVEETTETAYDKTITLGKNSFRVGDRYRIVAAVLANNGAAGANTVKGYINGIGSGTLFTAAAVTFSANDVVMYQADLYVAALGGSGSLSQSGSVVAGTPGTATHRALAGVVAIDTTVNNVVTITNTPNNAADSSVLLFLSVEKL